MGFMAYLIAFETMMFARTKGDLVGEFSLGAS